MVKNEKEKDLRHTIATKFLKLFFEKIKEEVQNSENNIKQILKSLD